MGDSDRLVCVPAVIARGNARVGEFHRTDEHFGVVDAELDFDGEDCDGGDSVVSESEMIGRDASLRAAFMIPVGWSASRLSDCDLWWFEPNESRCWGVMSDSWELCRSELADSGSAKHWMGGRHEISGALCPNCCRPLLLMASLGLEDPRLRGVLPSVARLPLLFCWRCSVAQYAFCYSVSSDGVTILQYKSGPSSADFPYDGYPDEFPCQLLDLVPIPSEAVAAIANVNSGQCMSGDLPPTVRRFASPIHQVGGLPRMMYGRQDWLCPVCWSPMGVLAAICDDTFSDKPFTGNDYVQVVFLLCRKDSVVCAVQQCD